MDEKTASAKRHIDQIRSEEFFLGEDGNLIASLPGAIKSTQSLLEAVSGKLYEESVHFILELIQNAEDNDYDEEEIPSLIFHIIDDPTGTKGCRKCLMVANNEKGFSRKNMEAICRAGRSDKTKVEGYIGEKGIGFKSVFAVTPTAHILSAGYRIKLDQAPHPKVGLGFIIPEWLDEDIVTPQTEGANTRILLPLKGKHIDRLKTELTQLHPQVLLFLAKLKTIQVIDEGNELGRKIECESQDDEVILSEDGALLETYIVARQSFDRPKGNKEIDADAEENGRDEILASEITVALPQGAEGSGKLFAYLPTDVQTGLPFVVNADFLLVSSREAIKYDSGWNHWLRDCIAPTFIKAFKRGLESDKEVYRFIPDAGSLKNLGQKTKDFFEPVHQEIYRLLSREKVVLTSSGKLAKPDSCILMDEDALGLFAKKGRQKPAFLKDKHVVHPSLSGYKEVLRLIGVNDFDEDDVEKVLSDKKFLKSQGANWFVSLYCYLYSLRHDLRFENLPIVLLESGKLHEPGSGACYYLGEEAAGAKGVKEAIKGKRLPMMHPKLVKGLDQDWRAESFVESELNLKALDLSTYVLGTLVPNIDKLCSRKKIDVNKVVQLTKEVRDLLSGSERLRLRWDLCSLTQGPEKGEVVACKGYYGLLTPKRLNTEDGWQLAFPKVSDIDEQKRVIINDYLTGETPESIGKWKKFFKELGVEDAPDPKQENWGPWEKEFKAPGIFSIYEKLRHSETSQGFQYEDVLPPDWLSKLTGENAAAHSSARKTQALLKWLEKINSSQLKGQLYWFYHKAKRSLPGYSTFLNDLKTKPWIYTSKGYRKPSEVFVRNSKVEAALGDSVPYLEYEPSGQVVKLLQIQDKATAKDSLKRLKALSENQAKPEVSEIAGSYLQLDKGRKISMAELRKEFAEHKLIYVPGSDNCWFKVSEVMWPDLSGEGFVSLEQHYESLGLKKFFLEKVEIPETPEPGYVWKQWQDLAEAKNESPEVIEEKLAGIYDNLEKALGAKDFDPKLAEEIRENAKVWSTDHEFSSPDDMYMVDDNHVWKLFEEEGCGLNSFAWHPDGKSSSDYNNLFRDTLCLKSLSDSVERKASNVDEGLEEREVEKIITDSSKRLLVYYLRKRLGTPKLEVLKGNEQIIQLLRSLEIESEDLAVDYSLKDNPDITGTDQDALVYWESSDSSLYIKNGPKPRKLVREVAKHLAHEIEGLTCRDTIYIKEHLGLDEEDAEDLFEDENYTIHKGLDEWIKEQLPISEEESGEEEPDSTTTGGGKPDSTTTGGGKPGGTTTGGGKPDKTKPDPKKKKKPRKKRPRKPITGWKGVIVSPESEHDSDTDSKEHKITGEKGEAKIVECLREEGWEVQNMNEIRKNHKGYDLVGRRGDEEIYIEVKATQDTWKASGQVYITQSQYEAAEKHGVNYWLYVVESIDGDEPKIHRVQNPVGEISRYIFTQETWENESQGANF